MRYWKPIWRVFRLLSALPLLLAACTGDRWTEFRASPTNSGYRNVSSSLSLAPKWTVALNEEGFTRQWDGFSSPAIGLDGTIYVALSSVASSPSGEAGVLVAVSPEGHIKWRTNLGQGMVSSPSIGSNGNIYIASTYYTLKRKIPYTRLHSVREDGTTEWVRSFPNGFSTASPKVWGIGTEIRILLNGHDVDTRAAELAVYDPAGNVVAKQVLPHCSVIGSTSWFTFEDIVDVFEFIFSFEWWFPTFDVSALPWHEGRPLLDPTPAILIPDKTYLRRPLVIVTHECGTEAFRLDPSLSEQLIGIWVQRYEYPASGHGSPAMAGSEVIVPHGGVVLSYDAQTGEKLWQYDTGEIWTTSPSAPTAFAIYVTSLNYLHVIDLNGRLLAKIPLRRQTMASPSATLTAVYVDMNQGLAMYRGVDGSGVIAGEVRYAGRNNRLTNGMSSPAVGADGTVYLSEGAGILAAYPGPAG